MKKNYFLFFFLSIILSLNGCKKDDSTTSPVVSFKSDAAFVHDGAIVGEGSPIKFGITADGGGAKITNIVVKVSSEEGVKTLMDAGLWLDKLDTVLTFYKGTAQNETWTFTIMNRKRELANVSLNLIKDSIAHYGEIVTYPSITLGMQNNTSFGHFFDIKTGNVLSADEAAANPQLVDIAVYYYLDAGKPSPTFSSPGDIDAPTYYPGINNWSVKNYTKYDYVTQVGADAFDAAQNDSLLIKAYNEVWGKRKYKYAYPGFLFPIKTADGKIGIIKVIASDNEATGKITFALKIQK